MPRVAKKKASKKASKKVTVQVPYTGSGAYKRKNVKGKGSYTGPMEQLGTHFGSKLGRFLGRWTGTGDYTNSKGDTVLAPDPPKMQNYGDSIVISHSEYLGDILSSSVAGAFKVDSYGINPSDSNTFPWLSNVCKPNFQQYKFEQLIFEYRTFSADALNSTNTALGAVFACVNYDYSDPIVSSRTEVENTDWSNSCKPSTSMLIPVECDPKQTGLNSGLLYIINGNNIPANTDAKTYYLGRFMIGSVGTQAANVLLGSLYVHYKVRIYKPVMTLPLSNALIANYYRSGGSGAVPLGTANVASPYDCDSIGLTFTSGSVLTLNKARLQVGQRYVMIWQVTGASTAGLSCPNVTISSNGQGLLIFNGGNDTTINVPASTTITDTQVAKIVYFVVDNINSDLTITWDTAAVLPSAPLISLQIFQVCGLPNPQIGFFNPNA